MTTWHAFLLGLIQGITEFLPVSSSGHLTLAQHWLGLENLHEQLFFNVICHLGTLLAIFFFFFSRIKESLTHFNQFMPIFLGTLPLFPLVLLVKPLKALFNSPTLLGPCFIVSAFLLFAGTSWRFTLRHRWQASLTIGTFQALALFPGISRSGATISAASMLGWHKRQAIEFSFLLAIPAVMGATVLEAYHLWHSFSNPLISTPLSVFIVGLSSSFAFGCLALSLLKTMLMHNRWHYFAWYCLLLGIGTTLYFNL